MIRKASKVLVTGGAGFIGSHLVDRLVAEGCFVRIIDNFSTGKLANIEGPLSSGKVDLVKGDIRDTELASSCLRDIDVVVHLAALTSVPQSVKDPNNTYDVNVSGTLNMIVSAARNKVGKFIFISSCAVYGDPSQLPVSETAPTNPISPYAESKLMAERFCCGFDEQLLLKSVCLRLFNVYGPRQNLDDYSGVITIFIDRAKHGLPLKIYGDGSQTRDFVSVSDVVDAILESIENDGANGQIFNIGSGKPTSIEELAKTITKLASPASEIVHEKPRKGDIKHSYADIKKATEHLGYATRFSLRDGLRGLLEEKRVSD